MNHSILDNPSQCRHCGSNNLIRLTGTDEPSQHYGRLSCIDCGRWLAWLRDPSTSLQWQLRAEVIDKLLIGHGNRISVWERSFLQSVQEQRNLSPKQKDRLNAIGLKYLGMHICATDAPIKNPALDSRGVGVR